MLLAQGKIIYLNEAKYSVGHFEGIGFKCPELSNPADYFMSIMSIESQEVDDNEDEQHVQKSQADIYQAYTERINFFTEKYQNSELRNDYAYISTEVTPLTDADKDDN